MNSTHADGGPLSPSEHAWRCHSHSPLTCGPKVLKVYVRMQVSLWVSRGIYDSKFINWWQNIEWLKLEAWYFALIDLQICYTGAGNKPKVLVWDLTSREENTWEVRVSKQGTLTQLINYEKEESLAAIFVYTEQTNFWFLKGFIWFFV